jgi:general secretion pathway protein D
MMTKLRQFAVAMLLVTTVLCAVAQPVTLNLKDADIQSLIQTVSSITGKNFIVDPRVKGKVTVVASDPMSEEEVYEVFLSVLRVHGFAAVPSGDVIKIVPEANAKQDSIPNAGQQGLPGRDQMVTLVIPLENVAAAQLVPVLRPLVPPQGHLAAYSPTNVLIVSDRAANVDRLRQIIKRVDLASEEEVEVVRLQHASASEVVRILASLAPQRGGPEGVGTASVRLVADDRTNSVIMSGERAQRLRYRTIVAHLDTPLVTSGNTHVIYLRYAKAPDLVALLQGVSSSYGGSQGGGAEGAPAVPGLSKIDIQADESTNALVVTAPQDTLATLKQVIAQLDIRRAQVQIEAVIADITSDRAAQLGVNWIIDASDQSPGAVGVINLGDGLNRGRFLLDSGADIGDGSNFPGGATVGIGKLSGSVQFAAVISALASDGDTNLLSTPTLVTLDNEEAEIVVGDNVPFVTGQFTNTGASEGAVNPFQTIERQDVGLTLRVKPQINEGNSIRMEITQEVSSLRSAAASVAVGASDITTTKRSIKTTVLADDGQVIVLGGLIDDTSREVLNKVPGLGDIPILGKLFQYRDTELAKRNLMVFIRPVIIREPNSATVLTNRKYSYIRDQQLLQQADGISLLPDASVPVLPTPEEIEKQGGLTPVYQSRVESEIEVEQKGLTNGQQFDYSDKESLPEW